MLGLFPMKQMLDIVQSPSSFHPKEKSLLELYSQLLVLKMPQLKQKLGNHHKDVAVLTRNFFDKQEFRDLSVQGKTLFFNLFLFTFFLDQLTDRGLIFKSFAQKFK